MTIERLLYKLLLFHFLLVSGLLNAQNTYRYKVDLNSLKNDQLHIELLTPDVNKQSVVFAFPKIIPGTYNISNYGQFVSDVAAFDQSGKRLSVTKMGANQWKISNAGKLHKITYTVDDIFDTRQQHQVYPMAATDFEDGKVFVLHTPGVFGYIDGLNKLPFELTIKKPATLYGATALSPKTTTATQDVFVVPNLDELYDAPIMYTRPDTATVQVGNAQVLVSTYSPNQKLHAKELAGWMSDLLSAAKNYLGGKLPANRYAFLFYFHERNSGHAFPPGLGGALEHNASSFYYLPETDPSTIRTNLVDIAAHEFFHIITPLTISSKEVKEFNFDEAVLSKHLWLYEGVTEYTAHQVQVKYGLISPQEFLNRLSAKITNSRTQFNDTLSFTEMSRLSAGKYKDEYNNVYEKGALIAACLDLYLLHLSDGNYGLRNLTYDLGVRFGKDRYFNDDELFDEIGKLTYPEVKDFLVRYVQGLEAIPYQEYFGLAGVTFSPSVESRAVSFGGISMELNEKGQLVVGRQSKLNEFGKQLGYQVGDVLYAFNGAAVTPQTVGPVIDSLKRILKEGQPFSVQVGRTNAQGSVEPLTLSGVVTMVTTVEKNKLAFAALPTKKQELVRRAWLTANKTQPIADYPANPSDVASVDALIKATYDVISGPAGERNWNRFYSLFLPEAKMGASVQRPGGTAVFRSSTPAEYKQRNAPFFLQNGFYEEEIGRQTADFGNLVHVQSAYQFRLAPDSKVEERGVNYFTLVQSEGRWWISELVWQDESSETPIPSSLLKN